MNKSIVPSDSRYIPFTQQPACCVPTCFQIIMYRHNIPLIPAEELGFYLGLIVHPDRANLFYNVRTSITPSPSGYGTQIYKPEFEPNHVFQKLHIPLSLSIVPITAFQTEENIKTYLRDAEKKDKDVLLCFHQGTLMDNPSQDWGHVCVFDRVIDEQIRMIDPNPDQPKWHSVAANKLFEAMQKHGVKKSAGFWEIKVTRK